MGESAYFGADSVRREAGAEETAIQRGELALVERTVGVCEATPETRANERGFVRLGKDCVECSLDVLVWNAAGA